MGFSRQEYWSGLPFPSPGDLSDPRTEPGSPALQADSLLSDSPEKPFWPIVGLQKKSKCSIGECMSDCVGGEKKKKAQEKGKDGWQQYLPNPFKSDIVKLLVI